jgi:hypothetical protein
MLIANVPASAQFYVRSADVKKGELQLEEHGRSGPGGTSADGRRTRLS